MRNSHLRHEPSSNKYLLNDKKLEAFEHQQVYLKWLINCMLIFVVVQNVNVVRLMLDKCNTYCYKVILSAN